MQLPPLDSTHGRTTSGVEFHRHPWTAYMVERRRAWNAIIAFGQHTRLNDVGRGMPSWPLDTTHGRTKSGVACHHSPLMANKVERRQAWHAIIAIGLGDTLRRHRVWHAIIALGRETWSNDVERGIASTPWDSTHGRMTSGVA